MSRRRVRAATALGVVVLVAGCGGDPASPPASSGTPQPAPDTRREPGAGAASGAWADRPRGAGSAADQAAIGAVVQARADALGAGRGRAHARTGTGARRRLDVADARRARRLGVREVRVTELGIRVRGRRAVASVRSSYRLDRVRGRWSHAHVLRLRRTAGGWRVTALRARAPRPPWELATYRRSSTPHFTIFAPDGVRPDDGALGATLERAYATIRERLPGRPRRRYPVFVARGLGDMAAMTDGIRDVGQLSAITDLSVRTAGPAERVTAVVGVRILIPWPSFLEHEPAARERILTHELAHAVLAPETSGRAPAWLQEGIALYVSGDRRTSTARAALAAGARAPALGRLARPSAMAALAGSQLSAAYAQSSSTAYYVAGRFGARKLLRLLAAFGDESLPGHAGRALTDRVTRRVLGIGMRRLERDVAAWLRAGAPASGG